MNSGGRRDARPISAYYLELALLDAVIVAVDNGAALEKSAVILAIIHRDAVRPVQPPALGTGKRHIAGHAAHLQRNPLGLVDNSITTDFIFTFHKTPP